MKVVICGAGQVGFGIAERLAAERNDVSVIDTSPRLVQSLSEQLDVRGFVGHGAYPDVLAQAGAEQADMLIAVTLHDEVNMVACQVAHSLFNVPTKIARVRAQSYLAAHWRDLFSRDNLPIDVVISPEIEVGEMILRRLAVPGAIDTNSFADDKVVVAGIECAEECPVIDTPLKQLTELFPDLRAVVVGVFRSGKLFVPRSQDQLVAGDLAYVVAEASQLPRTLGIFGREEAPAGRIIIAGGGNIGRYVTLALEERLANANVKVVERDRDRALGIADDFRRAIVLNGSALDEALLREADVAQADTFAALTNDDEANILASVMAKRLGARRNLCLVNNTSYPQLLKGLDIDAHVSPRAITVSRILRHVRRGRIRAVQSVLDGKAEIIEAEALETSPLVGKPLRDLDMLDGVRIGAIYRAGRVVLPKGDTVIHANDRVVLFAEASKVPKVEQMFRVSLEFF